MQYTAAVIGLGQIGLNYDYHTVDHNFILTHAASFFNHPNYQLVAAVDISKEKCEQFTKKYNLPAFTHLDDLFSYQKPDVLAIAVPTQEHYSVCMNVLKHSPKAIICEKPIASSVDEAKKIIIEANRYQCALLVNYMRRFEPGVLKLKQILHDGMIGEVYKVCVSYANGLFNNGSHFIDLLHFLLGKVSGINIIQRGIKRDDNDVEPDFSCRIGEIEVYFFATQGKYYALYEVTMIGTNGIVRYQQGGERIIVQKAEQDPVFTAVTTLSSKNNIIPNEMNRYQWHVCDHLYNHLVHGDTLHSDGHSGTATLEVLENIKGSMN